MKWIVLIVIIAVLAAFAWYCDVSKIWPDRKLGDGGDGR
jgi:hypothetical protein